MVADGASRPDGQNMNTTAQYLTLRTSLQHRDATHIALTRGHLCLLSPLPTFTTARSHLCLAT
jgi:hypothetical protein